MKINKQLNKKKYKTKTKTKQIQTRRIYGIKRIIYEGW